MIQKPDVTGYTAATWDLKAYTKTYEKFQYGIARDLPEEEPELVHFADSAVLAEYAYMEGARVIPVQCTEKNQESTPAFPKMLEFETERDYLEECGMQEYVSAMVDPKTVRRRPIWYCFLKNEVLKEKKVKDNDIRVITCSDPVFTRIGAALDTVQNSRMKQKTETKHAQVGWTPFRGGLNRRLKRLERHDCFVELDWTRFDGTIPPWLFKRIRRIRWFMMDRTDRDKYQHLAKWYTANLVDRVTVFPTGEVTRIRKGNPSGQYSTTPDNNMVNEWLTAYEFGWLHRKQTGEIPSLETYRKSVDMLCYGDDRLLSYDSSFVEYEPEAVIDMYREHLGMWVKHENIKVSRSLVGLSFCGFTFTKKDGVYVGVMTPEKLLQSLKTPVRQLPNVEALWGKLVSLRILLEHSDDKSKEYLNRQIQKVEEYCRTEGIEIPEVGPDFYRTIW
nr:MAG: RNA-dependent RNA polymerase [Astroviridae sp.]QKN88938.1 MAG: RNA-dependent RNA polymerase [Astroviridae sp.]